MVFYVGQVSYQRRLCANTFEAIPYQRGYSDELIVRFTDKDFLKDSLGWTVVAVIKQHQFYGAYWNCVVERHMAVMMPSLDCAWMNARKVHLSKS
jgi:hypothetical protein